MKINTKERVSIYIDIENIEKGLNNLSGHLAMDYKELVTMLVGDRTFVAAYVFDACSGEDGKFKRMKRVTSNPGFRPVVLPFNSGRPEQKGVDMELGLKVYKEALNDRYDTAIVLSGDADFIPVMRYVQEEGKKVEVAAFKDTLNDDVRWAADSFTELDSLNVLCMKTATTGKAPTHAQVRSGKVMV